MNLHFAGLIEECYIRRNEVINNLDPGIYVNLCVRGSPVILVIDSAENGEAASSRKEGLNMITYAGIDAHTTN